jgi:hypothetical protein
MDVQGLNSRSNIVNPTHRLEKLCGAASKRILKLRNRVSSLNPPVGFDDDVQVAWTVIETLNLWAAFLRAYYLSGAIETQTMSSVRVYFRLVAFPTKESAILFAIKTVKDAKFAKSSFTRFDEPAWHSIRNFLAVQNRVGASNLTQIHAALSAASSFDKRLQKVRNFYAHRCDSTFREAALVGVTLGLSSKAELRPGRILCSRLPKRPQNVITDWLDDMTSVINSLCS